MIGENWELLINESVEFENQLVKVQVCTKITDNFRGIY